MRLLFFVVYLQLFLLCLCALIIVLLFGFLKRLEIVLLKEFFSRIFTSWLLLVFLGCCLFCPASALAKECFKILVVFSYEDNYLWDVEIREEIEKVFSPSAELTFFYMNTKVALKNGVKKAAEAFALYQKMQPDGVIAVDDNAQSMFVVPYLKNRVSTPVMFCGVNAEPEAYGYPAKNVSGILERYHFEETISFNRQIAGKTETFAIMVNESPLAELIAKELKTGKDKLSAEMVALLRPATLSQAVNMVQNIRDKVDLLMLITLKGLVDASGNSVGDSESISTVVSAFNKPTAATAEFVVKNGALSGVLATGQEQGKMAATMLLRAMRGVPIDQLPVTRNYRGKRMINVTTMKSLDITPDPLALRGAKLVRSD